MNRLKHSDAILQAIDEVRALALMSDGRSCTVCLKAPSGELVGHFRMPSYEHVIALGRRLHALGYEMSILHPQHTGCDFVFAEAGAPAA